ncbi:hypothetical protein [Sphingomonas sp.]|uniref:hypothetical protein n=1 Tax=Sphingomonas sp. TaxID=28214 RepID=UPI001B0063F8|nr:hypothetical protein [Sphingomonas sp.]MBO9713758.1 hypothetical protein [Sphingomonas sp.]
MRHLFALLALLTVAAAPVQTAAALDNTTVAPVVQPAASATNLPAVIPPQQQQGGAVAANQQSGAVTTSGDNNQPQVILDSGAVLLKLFVLSAILESALALFFNWRPVARLFNRKGLKPVLSFALALAVTTGFKSHLFATLFASYGYDTTGATALLMCQLLEAAVLAGGSSGVNRLLRNLGIRPIDPVAEQNPQPRPQEAWLSVSHRRVNAEGTAQVEFAQGVDPLAAQWEIAGQVTGTRPIGALARWLIQDPSRFPPSGGHSVTPGVSYMVRLTGMDGGGKPIASQVWGPNALADRAIVDIELSL